MKLSISAWKDSRYISLSQLLGLMGPFFSEQQWFVNVHEAAPEPGAVLLEECDQEHPLRVDKLIRISTSNIQIIDGTIHAINTAGDIALLLRAVDSTSWDIETNNTEAITALIMAFPDLVILDDR